MNKKDFELIIKMIDKRLNQKIKEMTGLDEGGVYWYKKFIEASSLVDEIVMFGEIKHEIRRLISISEEIEFNSIDKKKIDEAYDLILDNFKERGLVGDYFSGETCYPKILGYNFYDDEEFYFKTRTKGEMNWTGRIPKEGIYPKGIIREIIYGSEFENKELEQMVLN